MPNRAGLQRSLSHPRGKDQPLSKGDSIVAGPACQNWADGHLSERFVGGANNEGVRHLIFSWVTCGGRPLKNFLTFCSWRVRSRVRPVVSAGAAAGPNALRGAGGCCFPERLAIHWTGERFVLATAAFFMNSFACSGPVSKRPFMEQEVRHGEEAVRSKQQNYTA